MQALEDVWGKFYGFKDKIPAKSNLEGRMRTMPKEEAYQHKYLQTNHSDWINIIVVDIDLSNAEDVINDRVSNGYPVPNITIMNPKSKHIHAVWLLSEGVDRNNQNDMQTLNVVQRKLNYIFEGDANYTKFILRNPFFVNHFTRLLRDTPYATINLFNVLLDIEIDNSVREVNHAGRNTFLFNNLKKLVHKQFRKVTTKDDLLTFAQDRASKINDSFDSPLSNKEIMATANSIVEWTWKNFSRGEYEQTQREKQARRMARIQAGDYSREPKLLEKYNRRKEMWKYRQQNWTYQEIANKMGLTFREVANGINYSKKKKEFEVEN